MGFPGVRVAAALVLSAAGCSDPSTERGASSAVFLPSSASVQCPEAGRQWSIADLKMDFVWLPVLDCWVGTYEVTNAQFRAFQPCHNSGQFSGHDLNRDSQPVVQVSYDDVLAFTEWLCWRERHAGRLGENWVYRLPTVREWLTFAQCGQHARYPWGDDWPPPGNLNLHGREGARPECHQIEGHDDGYPVTCPVDEAGSNAWGLFGVAGNAAEWTSDLFNAKGWRKTCGGSWSSGSPPECQILPRQSPATTRDTDLGFRVVLAHSNPGLGRN